MIVAYFPNHIDYSGAARKDGFLDSPEVPMTISYGAPILSRPCLHQRGDAYLLLNSRRCISRAAVCSPPRGSAVQVAARLVGCGVELPQFVRDLCQCELLSGESWQP